MVMLDVRCKTADGRMRGERVMISVMEWKLDRGGLHARILRLVDEAVSAAEEAERQVRFAAGPVGVLP
jgi:hypothetical protein